MSIVEQFLRGVPMRVGVEIELGTLNRRTLSMTATYKGEIIYRWAWVQRGPHRMWLTTNDSRYKLDTRDDRRFKADRR